MGRFIILKRCGTKKADIKKSEDFLNFFEKSTCILKKSTIIFHFSAG